MIRENYYPLLVKYVISTTVGNSEMANFSDWNLVYALKENPTGYVERLSYGMELDFDRIIIVDASEKTRKIKPNSIFLIEEYPTCNNEKGNYIITKIFPEYLGKIMIALKASKINSLPRLYYFDSGLNKICAYQLNFDKKNMKGYIGKYDDHPFRQGMKIWYREPINAEDTEYMVKFVSETLVGIINNLRKYKELVFEQI